MTKKVLLAAVAVTTLILTIAHLAGRDYWVAAAAFLVGAAWLTLEIYDRSTFPGVFFVLFACLAIVASLRSISMFIVLLGLCTDLAAWDISRFLSRIRQASKSEAGPEVYKKHLYKLAMPLCAGYAVAVVPVLFKLPLSFIGLFGLALLAVVALRSAILSLRNG